MRVNYSYEHFVLSIIHILSFPVKEKKLKNLKLWIENGLTYAIE